MIDDSTMNRLLANEDFNDYLREVQVMRHRSLEQLAYTLSSTDKDYSIQGKIMAFDEILNLFGKNRFFSEDD